MPVTKRQPEREREVRLLGNDDGDAQQLLTNEQLGVCRRLCTVRERQRNLRLALLRDRNLGVPSVPDDVHRTKPDARHRFITDHRGYRHGACRSW